MPIRADDFRFQPGRRLADVDPASTGPYATEDDARDETAEGARELGRRQHMLTAHGRHGLLAIFQGMDASGKDEAIHHVMSAIDPQASTATQFDRMTKDEKPRDFLWRAFESLPPRGSVGVFNRSYYEHVVGERVHPETVQEQPVPERVRTKAADGTLWDERLRQIRDVERYWTENGIHVVKLYLHVSPEAQRRRLIERTERPEKRWDFSRADVEERQHWATYLHAYDEAFRATSTEGSPWYIVPADHKWAARATVAAILNAHLGALHDDFPEPDDDLQDLLDWARGELSDEKSSDE